MKNSETLSRKGSKLTLELKSTLKILSEKEKEIIRLLQNKETIITDYRSRIFVTSGNDVKRIRLPEFYTLVNNGLIYHQTEWPFSYVLSTTGEIIEV